MVELRDLRYAAGKTTIIAGVSLRFRTGRFNVVVGPNGAGKSTLLKLATGLLRPDAGEVLYDGRPVSAFAADELARRRAVLSQQVELAFPLAVRDVALMGRYPHYGRTPSPRDLSIVDRALEVVGMTDRRDQPYPTLSGGERQKVQLARVLAQIWKENGDRGAPRVLFLDEPTSSLDVHYQLHLLEVARALTADGCTVVAVLHDLNTAFRHGDAFFLLDRGRLALETDDPATIPAELIERVFQVRARRLADPASGDSVWRFEL